MATSSATMKNIPEDLVREILVYLPVKSLLRFRCVRKSWSNLIKTRDFIKMHLKLHSDSKNECILVVHGHENKTNGYLSFLSSETLERIPSSPILQLWDLKFDSLDVCGPCNGLIYASDNTNIILCNPSTREYKLLPLSSSFLGSRSCLMTRVSIGFGFNSSKNDFRVVTFVKEKRLIGLKIFREVYRLSTNSWKVYESVKFLKTIYRGRCGTLYKGSFYWLVYKIDKLFILSYNMSNKQISFMSLPDQELFHKEFVRHIRVVNDSLALLLYNEPHLHENMYMYVEVWVVNNVLDVARTCTILFRIGPLIGMHEPLSIWKNDTLLIDSEEGQLVSCDHEVTRYNIYGGISQTMVYKESLVLLNN